jgi:hypothetical protein
MKMTMNLNNTSTSFSCGWNEAGATPFIACTSVANPLGGINPSMVSSIAPIDIRDLRISSTSASITTGAVAGTVPAFTITGSGGVAGGSGRLGFCLVEW